MVCEHHNFHADVEINRNVDPAGISLTLFQANLTIRCRDCGEYFESVGLSSGYSSDVLYQGRNRTGEPEIRIPIRPVSETMTT
jgi:hypothetical protein